MSSEEKTTNKVDDDSVTKKEAGGPDNVGESTTRRGEKVVTGEGKEAGRHDIGTQGASKRPVGTSTARDSTGIDPQDPKDE